MGFLPSEISFWQYQAWWTRENFEFTYMDFRARTQYYVLQSSIFWPAVHFNSLCSLLQRTAGSFL